MSETKKRRGRPAKTNASKEPAKEPTKEPNAKAVKEPAKEPAKEPKEQPTASKEPKALVTPAKEPKRVSASKTRQRARPPPIPTTLSIASYGKRTTSENIVQNVIVQDDSDDDDNVESDVVMTDATPIVLSLPISDALESKLSSETLDVKLTSYRPDVLLSPKVPKGLLSSVVGAEYQSSTVTTLERCDECSSLIGPCKKCIDTFNRKSATSIEAYRDARKRDDAELMSKAQQFQNVLIEDNPIDHQVFESVHYDPNIIEPGPVDLSEVPRAYTEQLTARAESLISSTKSVRSSEPKPNMAEPQKKSINEPRAIGEISDPNANLNECLWHLLPFEGPPVGLPLSFNEATQTFQCIGNFCSLECAYAYRLEHKSAEACPIRLLHLAHSMRSDGSGSAEKLKPAPPRQALKRFGGTMDYETFLQSVNWFTVRHQPFVFSKESVECFDDPMMYRSYSGVGHTNNFGTGSGSAGPTNELVRKRDKPHPNMVNQWESSIQRSRKRN